MKSATDHQSEILASLRAIEPLEVNLLGSVGCVLADDISSEDERGNSHVLLPKGTLIGARHIALLAAAGLGHVMVHPKPRVVVLTVGAKLVDPGKQDSLEDIPDINGLALTSAANAAGAMTYRVGPVLPDMKSLTSIVEDQLVRADIIVTACGMSATDYDALTSVVSELGEVELSKISMQPGSAQGFGHIGPDSTPIFVLPANPVAALLSFDLFVLPAIRTLMGQTRVHPSTAHAKIVEALTPSETDTRYVRGILLEKDGVLSVRPLETDGADALITLAHADCVLVIPPGKKPLEVGTSVTVLQVSE